MSLPAQPSHKRVRSDDTDDGDRTEGYLAARALGFDAVPNQPERRLLRAVLEQAIEDLGRRTKEHHGVADAAEIWFASGSTAWLFSFVNICMFLDIPPDAVRRRVSQIITTRDQNLGLTKEESAA